MSEEDSDVANPETSRETIAPFVAGSGRTLLSAKEANRIIAPINSLINMRVGEGLKLTISESGILIELDDEA